MTVFITGGSKSGKSLLAQQIARELAGGGPLYYLATMVPADDEDRRRIENHIRERAGLGFDTLECPVNILSCLSRSDRSGTFLLDSVTALLSNEMFTDSGVNLTAAEKTASELEALSQAVGNLVIVSDSIFSDAAKYDRLTESFRSGLAHIDRRMAKISDSAYEVCSGIPINLKQPYDMKGESTMTALIIGGAHQGKTDFAICRFGLSEKDICICSRDREPDFSKRCLCHLECYARRCMDKGVNGQEPLAKWLDDHPDGIIILDDIFCGVVPLDKDLRAWREETGRLSRFAAEKAGAVIRICCGLPQRLK